MSARVAADPADSLRRHDGRGSGRNKRSNVPRDVQHRMNCELTNFLRIYPPDELSQRIIGSNELSLNAIEMTRFRENKRSTEVTKKATTRQAPVEKQSLKVRHRSALTQRKYWRCITKSRGEAGLHTLPKS
jgi:hypothetical protein